MTSRSDLREISARVTQDRPGYVRGPGGLEDQEPVWEKLRRKTARALVAEPDLLVYFAGLGANRAAAEATRLTAALNRLVQAVEGLRYERVVNAPPDGLAVAVSSTLGRGVVTDTDVLVLQTTARKYLEESLLPAVSRRGRARMPASEARATYTTEFTLLEGSWDRFLVALSGSFSRRRLTPATLRTAALQTPLESLSTTIEAMDPAKLTDFTLQFAATTAALSALGTPLELGVRFRLGSTAHPAGLTATAGYAGGFVTTVTPSVSPRALGVRSGDLVRAGLGSATVTAVGETALELASSSITDITELRVLSAPYSRWSGTAADLQTTFGKLPTWAQLNARVQALARDQSAASTRETMVYFARLASYLDAVSSDAAASLGRVGAAVPVYADSVVSVVQAADARVSARVRRIGDRLLSEIEGAGFDYAVTLLFQGEVDTLLREDALLLSRYGRVQDRYNTLGGFMGGTSGLG